MTTSSSPSARLRPFRPQPFGRYTLLSHLATGGMGEIYLARLEGAQGFEKLCVIKKILPQLAEDKEFVDRFVGEARTLVKLSHGSIAQVLDMGLHEGDAYMALEYVDGKDLRKVAGRVRDRQTPLPLTFVLFVMGRVLDALAYAHRKRDDDEKEINLVHRDISPPNILISYEGEVKVIDFGLAKSRLSAAKTNPSIILGKFLYMSPEQARHQPVDRRSDLYAVGLCLYELISGKNPFDSVHPGELMTAVASPRISPLNEVEPFTPPSVVQLVMKALAVEPTQRFQTAEEFRGRLVACLMEIDPGAGPESISRFMRELFAAEYQGERKLLTQLKEVPRLAEPTSRSTVPTDPATRVPPPAPPPRTPKQEGPAGPPSFQPTPRGREGAPAREGETRPGVPLGEPTRPAASFEALDATARARVRPSLASTSPTIETATLEVRPEELARLGPPVASVAPPPLHSNAPTLEMPIPVLPAAAFPPGLAPPPPASAPAARPPEPPRPAAPLRPAAPPGPPAPPSPAAAMVPPPLPVLTPPDPMLALSKVEPRSSLPTLPEIPLTPSPPAEPPVAVRESPRVSAARAALAEPEGVPARSTDPLEALFPDAKPAPQDPSRRGLDDTHPSYLMASGAARPHDTQPRVVLDEAALSKQDAQEGPEEVIVSGVLEEPAPAAARPAPPRRSSRGSSSGMPAVARGASAPARGGARPPELEPSEPEFSVELDETLELRDPREETRRTPIPTRPGESSRRVHREEPRHTKRPTPPQKSSWAWLAMSLMLLAVAGGAVAVAYPSLEHLLPFGPEQASGPPPLMPIPQALVPGEAPGASAPAAASAGAPSAPSASAPAPEAAPKPTPEAAAPAAPEDDVFIPLTPPPAAKKTQPARTIRRPATRKESELQKEWTLTSRAFQKLTGVQSCESPKIGLLCRRYESLQGDMEQTEGPPSKELINKMKRLRREILAATSTSP